MLYKTSADKVLLCDEIECLENFINIEQMRFSDGPEVSFQRSGDIEGKMVSPLLLLPFVENAFKHGNSGPSAWITINLKVSGNTLIMKVKNSYRPVRLESDSGLGIANLTRRLELTYPGKHDIKLIRHQEYFEASLKLDI